MKVAIVETKPSRNDYRRLFEGAFDFDQYQLTQDASLKRVLKKDVTIDMNPDEYDWVVLIGSEPLKHFTKETSITDYTGKKVGDNMLACINPAQLMFKPEVKPAWENSRTSITEYINGQKQDFVVDEQLIIGIEDEEQAKAYLQAALEWDCPYFALDSETTGLYPRNGYPIGISLCYRPDRGAYILSEALTGDNEDLFRELCRKKRTVFHNSKFDMAMMQYHFNCDFPEFEDTMLLHYIIDENPGTHGLKQLALKYTKYGDYEKELSNWIADYCRKFGITKSDFTYDLIPFEIMKNYAAIDAVVTFDIFQMFTGDKALANGNKANILANDKLKWVYDNILIPGTRFLTNIQDNGVPFNEERLRLAQSIMQEDIDKAINTLYEDDRVKEFERVLGKDFNPNSTVQLRSLLFDYLGLQPTGKKTGTGANSTDAEVLEILAESSEVPGLILDIRQKSKIKNTYLDKIIPNLDRDRRLRTNFNLHGTTSGRLSSSGKLNMQQLPRDNPAVKGCIMAAPGHKIVAMDLTTAEMYIAAVLSQDAALMDVFRSGGDFHGAVAHKVFKLPCEIEEVKDMYPLLRQAAKAVSFGIMYGAGAPKIAETVTQATGTYFSKQEAQEAIDEYFQTFHKLKEWIEKEQRFIEYNGFIYSYFGRKRRLPNVKSTDKGVKSHSIRSGINFLVQSVASDINLLGAIDMEAYIRSTGMKAKMFALVHDSILAEVPDDEIEHYKEKLVHFVQLDRGASIPGFPIGCDFEIIHQDYSGGKFEDKFADWL